MDLPKYSVLMSVYAKEKPEYLRVAMESMWSQTIPPDDFVLVCDGPLSDELDLVINKMKEDYNERLTVVRLKDNNGLGKALNIGMERCKNDLIARMDSDDISYPDRCEKQLEIFTQRPEISICSGTVEEFCIDKEKVETIRRLPEKNWQILDYAKKRNPFNHPCVMYRKADVQASGGYKDFYLLEDYFLWLRMLMYDYRGYNIQDPILWMRTGNGFYHRRGGVKYAISQYRLFGVMLKAHFIKIIDYALSIIIRTLMAIIPDKLRRLVYKIIRNH